VHHQTVLSNAELETPTQSWRPPLPVMEIKACSTRLGCS
jgi:hypothetical protein